MGFHSLLIGGSALAAANYGLQVTGQNLSNVNTAGYSRQVLRQSGVANSAGHMQNGVLGSGVSVTSVSRVADAYAEKQLRQATADLSYYSGLKTCYSNTEAFFNELSGSAVSDYMNSFWDSMSDVANHVETLSTRSVLLEDAAALTGALNDLYAELSEYRLDINAKVRDSVSRINDLIQTVADLNRTIVTTESGGVTGVTASDLRDQRDAALSQLSELLAVDVLEEQNGSCIVSAHGRTLVYFDQTYELAVENEKVGDLLVATPVFASDGYPVNPDGGDLAAQLEIRDSVLTGYIDELDQLAASFTWEFNRVYSQTRGTEPFSSLTSLNAPLDPGVTLDQLQYKDSVPEGSFQIVNGNLELIVVNQGIGQETSINVEIDLDGRLGPGGEPDTILWDPANPDASNSLVNRLQKALDEAAPGAFSVTIDNQYRVSIESLSEDYGFCFGEDSSGVLAALGLNAFFTGHGAETIGVNPDLGSNLALVGVSYSFASGDNGGAQALLDFRDAGCDRLQGMSGEQFYQYVAGRLAGESATVAAQYELKEDLYTQMFNQREQISGVSEDEESIKLIAYQRAYQSAAKFISIVDECYETLINM
jgi:flagellar hook-associated protein 1 FlgK